jgi:ribosomal RNA-processing protein 7
MDADGFVVVSRKRTGRSIATDGSGATVGVATAGMERHAAEQQGEGDAEGDAEGGGGARKKKKKPKEMVDFYHFQQHERKRSQLLKLREQFEQDKSKIAKMREARAFKPY